MKIRRIRSLAVWVSLSAAAVIAAVLLISGTGFLRAIFGALAGAVAAFPLTLILVRKYVIYKIKPLYNIVLSRDVKTGELEQQYAMKGMVGTMESELSVWAERNEVEIARLKENEKYRKEFLGNISHEMKTPIFTLQGYILTLLDGGLEDSAVNRRYLERAEKSVDRMIDIVTDLEEISRLESGMLEMRRERFDIASLAREIAEDAAMEADKKGIKIFISGIESPAKAVQSVWVTAGRKYMEQVLWNLVTNSIKYGREGGRTDINFLDVFDKVMVEVADDGMGIDQQDVPRVFERFYRTDKSRSREMGGTGLGLSIVKHIIEAHGEKITLRSQPDKGSTFSFTISK